MRRVLLGLGGLLALLVLVAIAIVALVDPDDFREPLAAQISEVVGRPVEIGGMDLAWLPVPAIRASGVRVAGAGSGSPPFAEVEQVRMRLALLPLLVGTVALGSLEIASPRIHLELDDAGRPILPGADGPRTETERGIESEPREARPPEAGAVPAFAVERILVTDGAVTAGRWQVEGLSVDGRLKADGSAHFFIDADLPGLARLRAAEVSVEGLIDGPMRIEGSGRIADADLSGLAAALELGEGWTGRVEGRVEAKLADAEVEHVRVELAANEVAIRAGTASLSGGLGVEAELPGAWRVDLTESALAFGEGFAKPSGRALEVRGSIERVPPERLEGVVVSLPPNEITLDVALGPGSPVIDVRATTLELEPLAALISQPVEGRVHTEGVRLVAAPFAVDGAIALDGVHYALNGEPALLTGTLRARGTRVDSEALELTIAEQVVQLAVRYGLDTGRLALDVAIDDQNLETLERGLRGKSTVTGTLAVGTASTLALDAPDPIRALRASGRIDLRKGQIRGFSILKTALGELAALPILLAQLKGKDLSRYDQEEFERVNGDFEVRDGVARTSNLSLVYRHAVAELRGSVGLVDGALDLSGHILLGKELDEELGGRPGGPPTVIPIEGITGTIERPRVKIDREVLASIAVTYVTQGRVRAQLDEELGPGGADAVEGILNQILRGGKKR